MTAVIRIYSYLFWVLYRSLRFVGDLEEQAAGKAETAIVCIQTIVFMPIYTILIFKPHSSNYIFWLWLGAIFFTGVFVWVITHYAILSKRHRFLHAFESMPLNSRRIFDLLTLVATLAVIFGVAASMVIIQKNFHG